MKGTSFLLYVIDLSGKYCFFSEYLARILLAIL